MTACPVPSPPRLSVAVCPCRRGLEVSPRLSRGELTLHSWPHWGLAASREEGGGAPRPLIPAWLWVGAPLCRGDLDRPPYEFRRSRAPRSCRGGRPPPSSSCHGAGLSPFRKAVAPGPRERACCPPGVTHCSIHSLHKYGVPAVCPASGPPRSPARSSAHSLRRIDGNVVGETPPAPPTLWRKPPLGSDAVGTGSAAAGLGRRQRGPRPGRAGRGRSAPGPWTLSREGLTC